MSVLVTGGAGFVGSHLVDTLVAQGESVLVVDDLSTGSIANIAPSMRSGRVTFAFADISQSRSDLRSIAAKAGVGPLKAIFHLAESGPANSVATSACMKAALEDDALLVLPSSAYGKSRDCADDPSAADLRRLGLKSRIVRLFGGYGPRMRLDNRRLIPSLLHAGAAGRAFPIPGSGTQTQSMTFVADLVEGIVRVSTWNRGDCLPIDLGAQEEIAVVSIAKYVAEIAGVPFVPDFIPERLQYDTLPSPELSRAAAAGWTARTKLRDGLRVTYSWFLAQRVTYV